MTTRPVHSHIHSEDLLPPVPMGRVVGHAGGAAVVGAVVWALIAYFGHVEIGWVAWGIGGLVGIAAVKAGGHGTVVAILCGAIALVSIGSGKRLAFKMVVRAEVEKVVKVDQQSHDAVRETAAAWAGLGASPDDEAVKQFAMQHGFPFTNAASFRAEQGERLTAFHEGKPDLATWRGQLVDMAVDGASFIDHMKEDIHPADFLFVFLGVATAFGIVNRSTEARRLAARQALRAARAPEMPVPTDEPPAKD